MNQVAASMSSVIGRGQFQALVASRLSTLPSPFPALALIEIDIPNFSALRQTYGTSAAEELLMELTELIQRFSPDSIVGYIAEGHVALTHEFDPGWTQIDEFVADLRPIMSRLGEAMHAPGLCNPRFGAAVHIGRPARGALIDAATELLHKASLALALVPQHGIDGLVLYSEIHGQRIKSEMVLEQAMHQALIADEFLLHYQPLVDLETHRMVGMEGLIRWNLPGSGMVRPDEFIPLAESTGLIVPIGAKVIDMAARQIEAWLGSGWSPPRVAVNIAAQQLADPGFLGMVKAAVNEGKVDPAGIELEMTERTLVNSLSSARNVLQEIRAMGITLALDDFGTGYSSLQYLRELPISKIKIDRSFIKRIATDRRDKAMVKAVVDLAQALDLTVVAEGVEEETQVEALLETGCGIGQGYLFGRPQLPHLLPSWVF